MKQVLSYGYVVAFFSEVFYSLLCRPCYCSKWWRPSLDLKSSPEVRRTWELFLPGVAGAAVLQFNLLVSRFLAFAVEEGGMAVLFLASRLVELPLGIFQLRSLP